MAAPRCTCDNWSPDNPCPVHEQKAKILLHEMSTRRDYEPEIAQAQTDPDW